MARRRRLGADGGKAGGEDARRWRGGGEGTARTAVAASALARRRGVGESASRPREEGRGQRWRRRRGQRGAGQPETAPDAGAAAWSRGLEEAGDWRCRARDSGSRENCLVAETLRTGNPSNPR